MDTLSYIQTPKTERVILEINGQSKAHNSSLSPSSLSTTSSSQSQSKTLIGTLHLTAKQLIFVTLEGKEIWMLYMAIESVEKKSLTTRGTPIRIKCRDFRDFLFTFPKEKECANVYASLMHLAYPTELERLDAFSFTPSFEIVNDGWAFYNPHSEYARMGVPNDKWGLTDTNKDYSLCPTYSRWLFVPKAASDAVIQGSAKFRSKGRLPMLSYYYEINQATITRCSQPLVGIKQKRSTEDEQMIQCIFDANPNTRTHYIVDARPKKNAYANKAGGAGYEPLDWYLNCKYYFMDIENIHVMRDSLGKLVEACQPQNENFVAQVESSGWLKHIKAILEAASLIANIVGVEGASCVVHCSDGWDRTAQMIALAQIMLDPYYRTIHGFQAVIEKEWLWFGHKFMDRCGFLDKESKECSPVFAQFLDCVWQLTRQFPSKFEFNEKYLLTLHEHLYSCQYGTFLCNNEQARTARRISSRTTSLWSFIDSLRDEFVNPAYDPSGSNAPDAVSKAADAIRHAQAQISAQYQQQFSITTNKRSSGSLQQSSSPSLVPSLVLSTTGRLSRDQSGGEGERNQDESQSQKSTSVEGSEETAMLSASTAPSPPSSFVSNQNQIHASLPSGHGAVYLRQQFLQVAQQHRSHILHASNSPQNLSVWLSLYARSFDEIQPKESWIDKSGKLLDINEVETVKCAQAALRLWQRFHAVDTARANIIAKLQPYVEVEAKMHNSSEDSTSTFGNVTKTEAASATSLLLAESVLDLLVTRAISESEGIPILDDADSVKDVLQKISQYKQFHSNSNVDDNGDESCNGDNMNGNSSTQVASDLVDSIGVDAPPVWASDRDVKRCTICATIFDFVSRKHHCRACGQVVCLQCALKKIPLPQYMMLEPVRVCKTCYKRLK